MIDGHAGVKVATEQYEVESRPDELERGVSVTQQSRKFAVNVSGRLRSVTAQCVHSAACMYTVSADSGFLNDAHPIEENVVVVSACSGHGFKHSAGVGEAVALQVLGKDSAVDVRKVALSRFGS